MPSFSDSIFLFILALLLFGPKKLPVLARELGKWIGEFRRASNEFKMQMEDELRQSEQAERQKQIAAMEAAAPVVPTYEPEPEHPHLRDTEPDSDSPSIETVDASDPTLSATEPPPAMALDPLPAPLPAPLPIATSGSLNIMPPSTGLPTARGRKDNAPELAPENQSKALGGLIDSIPEAGSTHPEVQETAAHG